MIEGTVFRYNFEPNKIPFGAKSNEKLPQLEREWKSNFLSAAHQLICRMGKITSAVREAHASRLNRSPIKAPLKHLDTIVT